MILIVPRVASSHLECTYNIINCLLVIGVVDARQTAVGRSIVKPLSNIEMVYNCLFRVILRTMIPILHFQECDVRAIL